MLSTYFIYWYIYNDNLGLVELSVYIYFNYLYIGLRATNRAYNKWRIWYYKIYNHDKKNLNKIYKLYFFTFY